MSEQMIWVLGGAALISLVAALLLMMRAAAREKHEDVLLRLRAGEDEVTPLPGDELQSPWLRAICHFVWRTGADATPRTIMLMLGALLLLAVLLPLALGLLAGPAVLAVIVVLGFALLQRQGARRRAQIVEQLPDFLEGTMRVLVAGNTLEEALHVAAADSRDPIRTLFQRISRQVRLGASVDEVLAQYADIYGMRDLKVMAMAASINRRYGGSMRNVVRSLIQTIRNRELAARELRALTAETRFSAVVLALVPVGITIFILVRNPEYYVDMWASTSGRIALFLTAGLQLAGVYVLWRMLRGVENID